MSEMLLNLSNGVSQNKTSHSRMFGLSDSVSQKLREYYSEGLFEKDVTKLKDMMLSVGRKMLSQEYREHYAASLGDIIQNMGLKLNHVLETGTTNGSVIRLVASYFETLNDGQSAAVRLINKYADDRALTDHAVKLSLLSMAIAINHSRSRREVQDIGAMGLLAHVGLIPYIENLRSLDRPLSRFEQLTFNKVPQNSTTLLENLIGFPSKIAAVAGQIYELGDGTGFPRGLKHITTNLLARIARVADSYITLLEAKPYRFAVEPVAACAYLLNYAQQGKFDPQVVASLVNLVGHHPQGSQLLLSDGSQVTVLSASSDPARPIVVQEDDQSVIDLTQSSLSISHWLPQQGKIADWQELPEPTSTELPGCLSYQS